MLKPTKLLRTCQLVSGGRPEINIRNWVRRGLGPWRSLGAPKFSRPRGPRANWTVRRSPINDDPSGEHKHASKSAKAVAMPCQV